jgi:hypothetical protein
MTTTRLATLAVASATLFATALATTLPADASDRVRYRCRAKGAIDISLAAKFESRASRNRNKFSVEFEAGPGTGFVAGNQLTVAVVGVEVGSAILENVLGDAVFDLNFDTRPQLDSQAFPANWPTGVGAGTDVEVRNGEATVLGCTLG